jgi:hypothetical protein
MLHYCSVFCYPLLFHVSLPFVSMLFYASLPLVTLCFVVLLLLHILVFFYYFVLSCYFVLHCLVFHWSLDFLLSLSIWLFPPSQSLLQVFELSSKAWSSIQFKFFSIVFKKKFKKHFLGFFWKDFLWFSKNLCFSILMVFIIHIFSLFFTKFPISFYLFIVFCWDFCLWKEVGVFFRFLTFFPWWLKVSSFCKCL